MQEEGARVPETAPFRVVILGAGAIGLSFAATFEDAGAEVTLAEPDAARRDGVPQGLAVQRDAIALAGLTRNGGGSVTVTASADAAVGAADLVLECGPENVEAKRAIFAGLLAAAGPETVVATASSAITMSRIVEDEASQARCLVAHPINPPAVLRVVELVPASGTRPDTVTRAEAIFAAAGFAAVKLGHEIEGFVLNRLQGAILREAYRLVDEGVTDVAGIEAGVRLGLGPRWAFSGPFETAELNTPGGILAHAARMGPAYKRMGEARGETVDWRPDLVARVAAERRAVLPEDRIPARAAWRARAVARLVAARDRLLGDAND
jgi:3-hydroxyacyl-CoA dehydrogenase